MVALLPLRLTVLAVLVVLAVVAVLAVLAVVLLLEVNGPPSDVPRAPPP